MQNDEQRDREHQVGAVNIRAGTVNIYIGVDPAAAGGLAKSILSDSRAIRGLLSLLQGVLDEADADAPTPK